jgi:hypothetical protein
MAVAAPKRRSQFKKWLLATLALTFAVAVFYQLSIVLRVVRLKHVNPTTTALIEERASEALAAGQQPKREQVWVP